MCLIVRVQLQCVQLYCAPVSLSRALYAVRYRDPSPFTLCAIGMCAIAPCANGTLPRRAENFEAGGMPQINQPQWDRDQAREKRQGIG